MKKRYLSLVITILFLFPSSTILSTATQQPHINTIPTTTTEHTLYVDDDNTQGPWNGTLDHPYQYIRDAVTHAINGDTIFVFSGTYNEHLLLNKSLQILGENTDSTILDGTSHEFIIQITENGTTVQNFTLRNSGAGMKDAAIKLTAHHTLIKNCVFYRTKSAIYSSKTQDNDIEDCIFYTNGEGVGLYSCSNYRIRNCYFAHNAIGINLERCRNIDISGCYAQTNGIAFQYYRSINSTATRCAAYDNNDNQGGFFMRQCTNITITDCNVNHNGVGFKITSSSKITVTQSDILTNTHAAAWLDRQCTDIVVDHCEISNSKRIAILTYNSNCTVSYNNIYDSLFGIYTEQSACDARHNWWGSLLGPALFEHTTKDRIMTKNGSIQIFPWLFLKRSSFGSTWDIDPTLYHVIINTSRYTPLKLTGNDSDGDGAPDWWETKWNYNPLSWDDHQNLDPDKDGLNNLEECYTDQWGSNPFKKDIFLEIDWMQSQRVNVTNKPSSFFLKQMVRAFQQHNITLHVDDSSMNGGEEVPYRANYSYGVLRDYYWNYFLHNNMNNPRKGIFHYCLVSDYGPNNGFAFCGWDSLDSFQISAQAVQDAQPSFPRNRLIVGGIIHELGHTLGLNVDDFLGIDNRVTMIPFTYYWWHCRNYHSCMNYEHTYLVIDYSDGSHGTEDFNDWDHMDFSFFKNTNFEEPK